MTIQTTRHFSVTCGCAIDFTWDDTVDAIPLSAEQPCPHKETINVCDIHAQIHATTPGQPHLDLIRAEGEHYSNRVGMIQKAHPYSPIDWKFVNGNTELHVTYTDADGNTRKDISTRNPTPLNTNGTAN